MSDETWRRLADLVRLRREERQLNQQQLGEAAGTTGRLISDIERAARANYEPATLRAVARALGWTADSISNILAGRQPTPTDPDEDEGLRALVDELRQRLDDALDMIAVHEDRLHLVEMAITDPERSTAEEEPPRQKAG